MADMPEEPDDLADLAELIAEQHAEMPITATLIDRLSNNPDIVETVHAIVRAIGALEREIRDG